MGFVESAAAGVVNGMAKSGRVCVGRGGEVLDISLKATGGKWRPGAGPDETKTVVEGDRLCSSLQGPLACCVTPGLRDLSCRALAGPCPGNQGPVIHPEVPSPWSGGETTEPLVGAGVATSLQCGGGGAGGRAIDLVQNGGSGPLLGWAPHCGRDGGRVTPPAPTLSNSEACC